MHIIAKRLIVSCFILSPLCVSAQSQNRVTTQNDGGTSWLPYTSHGYVGASIGESDYDTDCVTGFSCDQNRTGFKVFTGGLINNIFGLELSYLELGKAEASGGRVRARGVDLSVIANAPIAEHFGIFGKVGTTYGWTKVDAAAPNVQTGSEHGFGLSYGAGLKYDINKQWGVRAEWERHRFQFVSNDRDVDLYSVGLNYRF